MRLRPLALGAIACMCGGTTALAQQAPTLPTAGSSREFGGTFSVRGGYDSNFARSNSTAAVSRGLSQEEYILTPRVTLNVVQPLGRQIVFLNGSAGYNFYRENSQLDRAQGQAQGGYLTVLGPCTTYTTGSFSAAQADLAQIDGPTTKNIVKSTTAAAGLNCSRGRSLFGGLSVQRTETKNSADIQSQADSTAKLVAASLGYGNETLGRLGLSYVFTDNDLPNRIDPGHPIGDGFFTNSISLTAERKFGSRLITRAGIGRTMVKREYAPVGTDLKFSSTTYNGALDYRFSSRLKLALTGQRAVVPAARAGKLYDIRTGGSVTGTYNLGSRFVVTLGHSIDDVKSNTDTTLPLLVVTKSRTNSTFGTFRYRQNDRLSLLFDVSYDDRKANLSDFNYNATRVGVAAEIGF